LELNQGKAYAWSRSRMGGWAIAQSPILGITITKARLIKRGYISLSTMFKMISDNSGMNTLFPMV
jgi:RNA-directed DNA polymerase